MLRKVAAAIVSRPFFYSLVQILSGGRLVIQRVREAIGNVSSGRVLDVGSSGGGVAYALGLDPASLVCLDNDFVPLVERRRRHAPGFAVQGDASRLPFVDGAFDVTLCTAVSHHLDDSQLSAALLEISRVTSGTFVFFDATRNDTRWLSRILWHFDRGRHPRTEHDLHGALERSFDTRKASSFSVLHRYFVHVGRPRRPELNVGR
ncbi:MAG: class I SAM-dependent methyltransferase [Thermoanaerobaculia bacterium]|nr:class I SAM-dependent methyltransferase [Thermoanaerobaculia bacterium]